MGERGEEVHVLGDLGSVRLRLWRAGGENQQCDHIQKIRLTELEGLD